MSLRIVHYINQFFGGIGGEETAEAPPRIERGPVGPGSGLQEALGDSGEVVATVICGDNYATGNAEAAASEITEMMADLRPDLVIAGPAFGSGRYGLACGHVCVAAQRNLDIPALMAVHEENPAAEQFRRKVTIVPTRKTAVGMGAALKDLSRLGLRLASGQRLGPPEEEGYMPRGLRLNEFSTTPAANRAVDMLLDKLAGRPYVTEWSLPVYDLIAPPPPLSNGDPHIALVAEGAVVPRGNPDRLPSAWATAWKEYELEGVSDLTSDTYETVHGGFDTSIANKDPDRLLPVDVMRMLEGEGRLHLHDHFFSTAGNMGSITEMARIGREMAQVVRQADGVQAVIVGAT